MQHITKVCQARFAFPDNAKIACDVQFESVDGWHSYLAVPNDTAEQGASLYAALMAGQYGPVASYSPPSADVLASSVRAERARRLAATDWSQLTDQSDATKLKYRTYRQALRDVTLQKGFPQQVDWPTAPL
jgi:Phage tail assembly chaperone protein